MTRPLGRALIVGAAHRLAVERPPLPLSRRRPRVPPAQTARLTLDRVQPPQDPLKGSGGGLAAREFQQLLEPFIPCLLTVLDGRKTLSSTAHGAPGHDQHVAEFRAPVALNPRSGQEGQGCVSAAAGFFCIRAPFRGHP